MYDTKRVVVENGYRWEYGPIDWLEAVLCFFGCHIWYPGHSRALCCGKDEEQSDA